MFSLDVSFKVNYFFFSTVCIILIIIIIILIIIYTLYKFSKELF